jgi:hypothetical protein
VDAERRERNDCDERAPNARRNILSLLATTTGVCSMTLRMNPPVQLGVSGWLSPLLFVQRDHGTCGL